MNPLTSPVPTVGPRCAAALTLFVVVAAGLAVPWASRAAPVLLPPHVLGPVPEEATGALVGAFLDELERRSGETAIELQGISCPDPAACEFAEGAGNPRYWLQVSGDTETLVAVALRLDGAVEAARATASGPPTTAASLGATLGADVADGVATGLTVDAGIRRATVWLDGDLVGQTPLALERPLPAGHHVVRIEARDGRTALALVLARAGEMADLQLDLSAVPKPSSEARAGRTPAGGGPFAAPQRGPGAWPLLPVAISAAVVGVLFATDPAGVFAPDYTITIVAPGS